MKPNNHRLAFFLGGCALLATFYLMAACHSARPVTAPDKSSLELSVIVLPSTAPDRHVVELQARNAGALYQLSGRLRFDTSVLQPLTVGRGELVDDRAAFFGLTDQPGLIPFAFTYHEGEQPVADAGGVARVEFEVLNPAGKLDVILIEDPEYLIARSSTGTVLEITGAGGK